MSETPPSDKNVVDEFQNLGKNLVGLLTAAWDNPERKRFQQELENGIVELGSHIRQEAEYFSQSPTGQRIRSDVDDLGERIRSSQAQEKARQEILHILQTANSELQKVINRWQGREAEAAEEAGPEEASSPEPDEAT